MVDYGYNIEAIVKFNDSVALVLDKPLVYKYRRIDKYTIIGECGMFVIAYYYEHCNYAKAFGGMKFTLEMVDGEIVQCDGAWWGGFNSTAKYYLSKRGTSITQVVINDKLSLMNCYVYCGSHAYTDEYAEFLLYYSDKVYDYREYENDVLKKEIAKQHKHELSCLYEHIITQGFRDIKNWKFDNDKYRITKLDRLTWNMENDISRDFKTSSHYTDICNLLGHTLTNVHTYGDETCVRARISLSKNNVIAFKIIIK